MPESIEQVQRAFSAYTIERESGSGGMAAVYLASDAKHGRKVAVKILHEAVASLLGAERFLQEIKLAATLQRPTHTRPHRLRCLRKRIEPQSVSTNAETIATPT